MRQAVRPQTLHVFTFAHGDLICQYFGRFIDLRLRVVCHGACYILDCSQRFLLCWCNRRVLLVKKQSLVIANTNFETVWFQTFSLILTVSKGKTSHLCRGEFWQLLLKFKFSCCQFLITQLLLGQDLWVAVGPANVQKKVTHEWQNTHFTTSLSDFDGRKQSWRCILHVKGEFVVEDFYVALATLQFLLKLSKVIVYLTQLPWTQETCITFKVTYKGGGLLFTPLY